MADLPEGWTDDMNIAVGPGHTVDEIVDFVLQSTIQHDSPAVMIEHLCNEFALTQADAELALDRTYGGLVRAATDRAENCPVKERDPVAWVSYQRCLKEPDLIAAIRPEYAKPVRKSWWRRLLS